MALVKLMAGVTIDLPTRDEVNAYIDDALEAMRVAVDERDRERERLRGIKWLRLPPVLQGTAVGGVLSLGNTKGQTVGPRLGYAWALRRLVVDGLTASATPGAAPDVVNLYRDSSTGQAPLWQFNGNNFGYSFNNLEMTLLGGETLSMASVGTFAATGVVRLTGELVELPAEMIAKVI
jgi:hypothetical protein